MGLDVGDCNGGGCCNGDTVDGLTGRFAAGLNNVFTVWFTGWVADSIAGCIDRVGALLACVLWLH